MTFPLYIDEDRISVELVAGLRNNGFDVLTCAEAGMIGKSDEEHLTYASSIGRVLYTANVGDFSEIHARWLRGGRVHTGIIACNSQRWSVGEQIRRISQVARFKSSTEMAGSLEHLSSYRPPSAT